MMMTMASHDHVQKLCGFVERTIKYVDFTGIRFFIDKKFDLISNDWLDEHEKLDLVSIFDESAPAASSDGGSLASILREARTFNFIDFDAGARLPEESNKTANIRSKKYTQLVHFGQLLVEQCKKHQVRCVFDVGCGLGHLLGWLAENSDLELVGLDCNKGLCEKGSNLYDRVTFHSVDIKDREAFKQIICSKPDKSAIVSLHGCGDIQKILIQEFSALNARHVPLLMTIGCCYHKMSVTENNGWLMSTMFKQKLTVEVNKHVLRLASECRPKNYFQISNIKRQKRLHSFISRNVTEIFYETLGIDTSNKPRSKRRKLGNSFDEIKHELVRRHGLGDGCESKKWLSLFDEIVETQKAYFPLVEVFLDLQYFLQEVYETLILLDRVVFIQENDINAELTPVFDAEVSPRNMCIVASR